jgi:hypothetical protein
MSKLPGNLRLVVSLSTDANEKTQFLAPPTVEECRQKIESSFCLQSGSYRMKYCDDMEED